MKIVAKADTPQEIIDAIKAMFPEGADGAPTEVVVMTSEELVQAQKDGKLEGLTPLRNPEDMRRILDGLMKNIDADSGRGILANLIAKGVGSDNIPYNGVDGDSCVCKTCNLRRLLRGTDTDLDTNREVTDEDKAALRSVKALRDIEEKLLEGVQADPEPEVYESLDKDRQNLTKLKAYIAIEEKLQERAAEYLDMIQKAEGMTRILQMMARSRIAGHEPSAIGHISEGVIMKMLGSIFEQLGMPKED